MYDSFHMQKDESLLYYINILRPGTAQKKKFSIKDFFSKCDKIRSFLRIWLNLLKKFLMETSFFVQWPLIC